MSQIDLGEETIIKNVTLDHDFNMEDISTETSQVGSEETIVKTFDIECGQVETKGKVADNNDHKLYACRLTSIVLILVILSGGAIVGSIFMLWSPTTVILYAGIILMAVCMISILIVCCASSVFG